MKVCGILLASGASRRLGEPKQLLKWEGKFLINHVIYEIVQSQINDLSVVLGANSEIISRIIEKDVKIIVNQEWGKGKSTSIIKGLDTLGHEIDAVIFFSVDQPFINRDLINKLIEAGSNSSANVVASRVNNTLTIPMLFKKAYFDQLKELTGEQGGKYLVKGSKDVLYLDWYDQRLLLDIDTKEDYEKILKLK